MKFTSVLPRPWLTLIMVALIFLTRTNAANLVINPPDATLGIFFLAGLWAPSLATFALLFAAGIGADLASFALGISDWCFTPAYVFLIPTYAALWFAGYFCRRVQIDSVLGAVKAVVSLAFATVVAYLVSTYSFLWFSGQVVTERQIAAYDASIVNSFPYYIGWAFFYAAFGLAIALVIRQSMPTFWTKVSGR